MKWVGKYRIMKKINLSLTAKKQVDKKVGAKKTVAAAKKTVAATKKAKPAAQKAKESERKFSFFGKKAKRDKEKIVTQEDLEQSREEILARGKRFKYPFQYSKHRLVFNTVLIGIAAVIALIIGGWYELYKVQNTGSIMYRFTKVLNLPVAKVDGVDVRYSDYLMIYRSSINSIEYQQGELDGSDDSKMLRQHYKREALNAAEDYSYALAKINEKGIAVETSEIDELVLYHMQINGRQRSEEAFEGIVEDNFGLSMTEYRRLLMLSLAKKKYSENYDQLAKDTLAKAEKLLAENSGDMKATADALVSDRIVSYDKTDGYVESANLDGGRAAIAKSLGSDGEISKPFVSKNGDSYYIVKLTGKKDNKVSYESIQVRFTEFNDKMDEIRENNQIEEYIDLSLSEVEIVVPEEMTSEMKEEE